MKLLVTAGPTREFIDPVRFISNRSSGKMGYAIARTAVAHGHEVVLVSGPVALAAPPGLRLVRVVSAQEMFDAVQTHFEWCDGLIMSAAVADSRPRVFSARKLKKERALDRLLLERTPDILATCGRRKGRRIVVGFAAETDHLEAEARRKLRVKRLDLIVANDVSRRDAGFDVDTNQVVMFAADGTRADVPLMSKDDVAKRIVSWIEARFAKTIEKPMAGSLRRGQRPRPQKRATAGVGRKIKRR